MHESVSLSLLLVGKTMQKLSLFFLTLIVSVTLCFVFHIPCVRMESLPFVIQPSENKSKHYSRNELKESIGQATKDAIHAVTQAEKRIGSVQTVIAGKYLGDALYNKNNNVLLSELLLEQKNIGQVQIELANIMQKFSWIIEKLVEDQRPFKRASRGDLQETLRVLESGHVLVKSQIVDLTRLEELVKNNTTQQNKLAQVSSVIQKHVGACRSLLVTMNNTKCLKNT